MNSEMEKDILKVLVTEEELKARIEELGAALYKKYEGRRPLFLGVLKGSFIFMADLMRASQLMHRMTISSKGRMLTLGLFFTMRGTPPFLSLQAVDFTAPCGTPGTQAFSYTTGFRTPI